MVQATQSAHVRTGRNSRKKCGLLNEHMNTLKELASLPAVLQPLVEVLKPLNTKNAETPDKRNVKKALKHLIDDENDEIIDAAFQLGGAVFVTATHLTVPRTLFRRYEEYAKAVKAEDGSDEYFKKEASIACLKNMLTQACVPGKQQHAAKARPAKHLLLELESDNKDVRASTSHTAPAPTTASTKKKSKKSKRTHRREE